MHWSVSGHNLSDASKLGHVDLDISGQGGVLLQSRVSSLAPTSSGRRVSLGSHALNGLLQWEHSASNRHKVDPCSATLSIALHHTPADPDTCCLEPVCHKKLYTDTCIIQAGNQIVYGGG